MSPAELLADLRGRGVLFWLSFTAEGMRGQMSGPLADADRQALATHREAILALLLDEARTEAERHDDPAAADRVVTFFTPSTNRRPPP